MGFYDMPTCEMVLHKNRLYHLNLNFQSTSSTEPDTELETEFIHPPKTVLASVNSHVQPCNHSLPRRVVVSNGEQGATVMLLDTSGEMRHGNIQVKANNREAPKKRKACNNHWVDIISRILFPGSYVTFLVLFWRQFVQQVPL